MKAGELQSVKQKNALLGRSYLSRDGEGADELFVWGDDFETILDILEEDDEIEEQFTSTVTEVSLICTNLGS